MADRPPACTKRFRGPLGPQRFQWLPGRCAVGHVIGPGCGSPTMFASRVVGDSQQRLCRSRFLRLKYGLYSGLADPPAYLRWNLPVHNTGDGVSDCRELGMRHTGSRSRQGNETSDAMSTNWDELCGYRIPFAVKNAQTSILIGYDGPRSQWKILSMLTCARGFMTTHWCE